MMDPEIQKIMLDPKVLSILKDFSEQPEMDIAGVQDPYVKTCMKKLEAAGLLTWLH